MIQEHLCISHKHNIYHIPHMDAHFSLYQFKESYTSDYG